MRRLVQCERSPRAAHESTLSACRWSKRMSTGWNRLSAETLRHEVEHCGDLLARDVELLDNLVDADILEVLDDRGHRQARAFEHPGTAHLAWDAFDGWTLRPVKRCHGRNSSLHITANWVG